MGRRNLEQGIGNREWRTGEWVTYTDKLESAALGRLKQHWSVCLKTELNFYLIN